MISRNKAGLGNLMNDAPKPGDYPIGSVESRMAMRAQLAEQGDGVTHVLIWTGLPRFSDGAPTIEPPDSIEHYQVADGSIVEVIRREYAPGKVTAFINQTWKDGTVYNGERELESLVDLEKTCRPIPLEPSVWGRDSGPRFAGVGGLPALKILRDRWDQNVNRCVGLQEKVVRRKLLDVNSDFSRPEVMLSS